jgi:hypothetical protein
MYSIKEINKLILYYIYTYIFILCYIFPVKFVVLNGNFALVGCLERITHKYIYFYVW